MPDFNIAEIAVTHTLYYEPSEYLDYCEENDIEPTESGFLNFIQPEIDEDFPNCASHICEIIHTNSDS